MDGEGFVHNERNSQATSSNAVTMTTEALFASFIFSRISHTLSCQERPAIQNFFGGLKFVVYDNELPTRVFDWQHHELITGASWFLPSPHNINEVGRHWQQVNAGTL